MSSISTDVENERRAATGLSRALLTHAAQGQNFLGFISYRRRDGLALAKWLRDRITSFQPPPELRAKIDAMDASVGGKQNRVFFDMSYQRPNVDFWDEHIAASLCRSRTLILLQTPSVFERLDDGEPNWCEREIETYLKYYNEPSRILVVMAPGAPIERFPEPLAKISARWDWIDLRFFSESPLQRFRYGGQYDPLVVKILAKIYNIADGDLPLLNREFVKARARVRRALSVAACTAIVCLTGLTAWALKERDRATAAEAVAVEQRDTAIKQRNAALVAQSRFLAKAADEQRNAGSARAAVAILREALPNPTNGNERPLVSEAVASAYRAIYDNRELGTLPLPAGSAALTSDGKAGRIIIATADRIIIRSGLAAEPAKEWPHDFGAPLRLVLSNSGNELLMTAADGAIMVRNLTDNRLMLRDAGAGRGTRAMFVEGGKRLLVSDSEQRTLRLFDLISGVVIANRTLLSTKNKAGRLFAEDDVIAAVVDAKLMRLSTSDLSTTAETDVPDRTDYVFALSADKSRLYVAAAEKLGAGSILCLDPKTLLLQRNFGRLSFGASSIVVSPTRDFLAVNNDAGVDFFETKNFETIGHVTSAPLSGGRFLKDSFFYVGYNAYGDILQVVPEILTTTAYKTIDGGAIQQIDLLEDGKGFLSLSDRPSITRWAFDPSTSSISMQVPLVVRNIDFRTPMTISASDFNKDTDQVVASYISGLAKRWNPQDGSSTVVKDPTDQFKNDASAVVALGRNVTLIAKKTGALQVYSDSTGPSAPAAELKTGPIATLGALSPTTAFLAVASEPKLIDASDPSHPTLRTIEKLGSCPRSGAAKGVALCVDDKGTLRAWRFSDDSLVADLPAPAGGLNAALVTEGGQFVLSADRHGNVELRKGGDSAVVRTWALRGMLRGKLLGIGLAKGLLSPQDANAVRAGKTSVEIPMSPAQFEMNGDQTQFAAVLPTGDIKLLTTAGDKVIDIPARDGRFVASLAFSANGTFLAVVDHTDDPKLLRSMVVIYDTVTGSRLFTFNSDPELVPTVHALSDGRGFVTINPRGTVLVHPIFDDPKGLISFLSEHFPLRLTAGQRKQFFIE